MAAIALRNSPSWNGDLQLKRHRKREKLRQQLGKSHAPGERRRRKRARWRDSRAETESPTLLPTNASFLVRIRADPKTVQTLPRHSDVKLTLQCYTHSVGEDRMAAAGAKLGTIFSHAADRKRTESGLSDRQFEFKSFTIIAARNRSGSR